MGTVQWTFKTWLSRFEGVDLPIGDLAADVKQADDFPEEDSFESFMEYFEEKGASRNVLEVFAEAWNYYKISTCEVGTLEELIRRNRM